MQDRCVEAYEDLREQVVRGQARPDGVGAIVFHGMWRGLSLLRRAQPDPHSLPGAARPSSPPAHDCRLVHLLANMVLLTQSREEYAY